MRAVAVQEVPHLVVLDAGIDQHHVDQRVEVVGRGLVRLFGSWLDRRVLQQLDLLRPDTCLSQSTPRSSTPGTSATSFCLRDLQAVDDDRGGVRIAVLAPAAEPAPAAVGELHLGQPLHAVLDHLPHFVLVEDRVAVEALPLRRRAGDRRRSPGR